MNRCCPLSITLPVSGSTNERARPPRCGLASRTTTRAPSAASRVAADSPANPPPITIASRIAPEPEGMGRSGSDFAERPGAQHHSKLLQARHADPSLEHAEIPPLDAPEEPQIDRPHDLRRHESRPVRPGQEPVRALEVTMRAL